MAAGSATLLLSTADPLLESATWLAFAQCPLQMYMTSTQPSCVALATAARHPSPCLLLLLVSSHILPQSFCWHLWHSSVRSFLPVPCSWGLLNQSVLAVAVLPPGIRNQALTQSLCCSAAWHLSQNAVICLLPSWHPPLAVQATQKEVVRPWRLAVASLRLPAPLQVIPSSGSRCHKWKSLMLLHYIGFLLEDMPSPAAFRGALCRCVLGG